MSGLMMALTLDHIFDHDAAVMSPENSGGVNAAAVAEFATVNACEGVICTVCMEGFRTGVGGKQVPCGHTFHANCILKWLSLHNSCPLCRSPVAGKFPP